MRTLCGTILTAAVALAAFGNDEKCPISENVRGHENIEWSISYAYGLTDATKDLPRVLLVGDSICNGYQNDVRDLLKGKVNVTYWVSSYCVTSPTYLPLLSVYLDEAKYDVVHFNNGLHSLSQTTIDAYSKGYRAALELIRRKQPQAKIVWCSCTPLYDIHYTGDRARYMKKVPKLNAAAAKVVAEFGVDGTDDLFALCNPLDRKENWRDGCHFRPSAIARQADQVAASVLAALNTRTNTAVEPFGVDMYVKSADFGYYIFRGTRSVATHYPEAGWSIGAMKDGSICFSIADGKSRSYVKWRSIDTTWREGEWNHVAGSFRNGELTLWVNGEKRTNNVHFVCDGFKTNVCCVTSIASPRAVVTNGCDAMTGGRFKGQVEDYRYFNHALTDADVSARAAKVAEMRANDPDAPKMVPDELGIDVAPPCAKPNTPLTIQPAPQKAELSDENAVLEEPFFIVVPEEEGFAKTAGELFQEVIAQGLAMTAKVVRADAELPADGTRFTFEVDESLGKEAYRIKGAVEQGRCRVKIHASDRGFFYAADTLRQLVRIRSIENGRRLSLPSRISVEDWPLMPHRVRIGGSWRNITPTAAKRFALSRVNGLWLNTLVKPVISLEKLREICQFCDSYGVDIVSGFSYLSLGDSLWTFAKPESMLAYKAHIDKLGQAGVKGLMFMFDDLHCCPKSAPAQAWNGDHEMRNRFRSEGAFHNALILQGLDWAKAWPNLGSAFKSACPEWYFRGWGDKGKAYFADFTRGFRERGVLMHHCVYESNEVTRLMEDGAETYCYYLNGLWPQKDFFTWYTGPESFRWSWYTWHVDLNGKGPIVNSEAINGIRTLHRRSQLFWCAAASGQARAQAGIISWNPPAYDPDLCDRATAQAFFGTGAYEQMRVIESALMPIVGYLGAYRTGHSIEFGVKVIPRHVGLSNKELNGYRRNYEAAEKAYAALEKAFAGQKTVFDMPYDHDQRQYALAELRKTLDIVRKRLSATVF